MQAWRLYLALAALGVAWTMSEGATAAEEPPNLVIINIDDLGYADVGAFGSELNRTPHIDRMAEEGRKLTSFYAAPVCSPSRASLMTGCYPMRVGLPQVLFPASPTGINADEHTLPELLKARGYATACIGKWHLGDQPEFLPTRHGFDYYYGIPYSNDMGPVKDGARSNLGEPLREGGKKKTDHPPIPLLRNETVVERMRGQEQTELVARYTDEALRFLRENRQRPFFLYLPHSAVHFPIYPGAAFQGKSQNGLYGDWVEEVDWSVGRVLDTLRDLKLDRQTLVLFVSDNGGTRRGVNAPLRGFKASTFEGGVRVPAIVWWPGRIPAGTSTGEMASMMDVLPTFVALAGGNIPGDRTIDGRDLRSVLLNRSGASSPREVFYYYAGPSLKAVRSGPWKLDFASSRLYNLEDDIGESTNVASSHADVVEKLQALAEQARGDLGDGAPGPGCRPPGCVREARPIIAHDGTVRAEFRATTN